MSVERLLPQMLMSTAAILVGILLVLMGLLRIGRSIKFHHHHRISSSVVVTIDRGQLEEFFRRSGWARWPISA